MNSNRSSCFFCTNTYRMHKEENKTLESYVGESVASCAGVARMLHVVHASPRPRHNEEVSSYNMSIIYIL